MDKPAVAAPVADVRPDVVVGTKLRGETMRVLRIVIVVAAIVTVAFAQQDKSKRPSPPGKAEVTLKGKKITIDYSRPKVQDPQTGKVRKMIGEHDPYGQVWRAGANEATTFVTEGDLDVNGTTVPAGNYTLFTLPEPDKWTLIISKKTGEWGIPYPEGNDLARIPMNVGKNDKFVDQFTISFDKKSDDSAVLNLTWENWKTSVPIKAK
jgi:hypothetical protein